MNAQAIRDAAAQVTDREWRLVDGRPHVDALSRILGYRITAAERDAALSAPPVEDAPEYGQCAARSGLNRWCLRGARYSGYCYQHAAKRGLIE